jgi:hypothetical protein
MIAFQVAPAVLGDPDRRHVEMPELGRALDAEEPGPAPARLRAAALDQPVLGHHPQHPLAVHRPAQLASDPGRDHPVAVGRVGLRHVDDRASTDSSAGGRRCGAVLGLGMR